MKQFSQALTAHAATRQVEVSHLADVAANAVDRAISAHLRKVIAVYKSSPAVAVGSVSEIGPAVFLSIRNSLADIAEWGRRRTLYGIRQTLPKPILQRMFVRRGRRFFEDDEDSGPVIGDISYSSFLDLVFPPPSPEQVHEIVYGSYSGQTWVQRLDGSTRYASPQQLASVVAVGAVIGKTAKQIEKDLMSIVNNARNSARRIARTEALRVSHEVQLRTWADGLGDMIAGYQMHATLDQNSRPAHAARHGVIYYQNPKIGQHSIADMPRPPLESDGSIAWNCRCHLSPVLEPLAGMENDPVFVNNDSQLIPSPLVYSEWFASATLKNKRQAVGQRRYEAVARILGGESPKWEDFVDPHSGELLAIDDLRQESQTARERRTEILRAKMDSRRQALRHVLRFGSSPLRP